jgi:hypothetical protein
MKKTEDIGMGEPEEVAKWLEKNGYKVLADVLKLANKNSEKEMSYGNKHGRETNEHQRWKSEHGI